MGDCRPLEEMLFRFLLYHCPEILNDEELFDKFLHFTHGLVRRSACIERERMMARVAKVSRK